MTACVLAKVTEPEISAETSTPNAEQIATQLRNRVAAAKARTTILPTTMSVNNGVKQAEADADSGAVLRVREAYEQAYLGNDQALQQMAREQGYNAHWLPANYEASIDSAATMSEIEDAFSRATIGKIPLRIASDANDIAELTRNISGTYTPTNDLESSKVYAKTMLSILNQIDPKVLSYGSVLDIAIVNSITVDNNFRAAGLHISDYVTFEYSATLGHDIPTDHRKIMLATDGIAGWSNDKVAMAKIALEIAGHEMGHDLAQLASNQEYVNGLPLVESKVSKLNPDGHTYAGYSNYSNSPTETSDGTVFAIDPYANADAVEDVGVHSEFLLQANEIPRYSGSIVAEKQQSLLFTFDEKFPGFASSIMSSKMDAMKLPAIKVLENSPHLAEGESDASLVLNGGAIVSSGWLVGSALAWLACRRRRQASTKAVAA